MVKFPSCSIDPNPRDLWVKLDYISQDLQKDISPSTISNFIKVKLQPNAI
jgi:hypothetical protein